jgi:hypothetical protein
MDSIEAAHDKVVPILSILCIHVKDSPDPIRDP